MPLTWTSADFSLTGPALNALLATFHDPIEVMLFSAERQLYLLREHGVRTQDADDPVLLRYRELSNQVQRRAA